MAQITLRVDDEFARQLKRAAHDKGCSVNAMAVHALRALVDPELAGDDAERVRERLRRAGILEEPSRLDRRRQDRKVVARARAAAGGATLASTIVSEDRS